MDDEEKKHDPEIEMLSQPLTTEDGFLNEACMNELSAAFNAMPPDYDRLGDDPEWSTKKDMWIFRQYITGAFAKAACVLSPYCCPAHLSEVVGYLNEALKTYFDWDAHGMLELSLCEINFALHTILMDQGITYFDAWNESKRPSNSKIDFVSAMDGVEDPDDGYISLDVLLRNTCLDIRMERRASRVFDRNFEQDWADTWPIDYQI